MYPGQGTTDLAANLCSWRPDKIQPTDLLCSRQYCTEQKGKRPPPSETAFSALLYQDSCDAKYQFHGVSFEILVNISNIPPLPTGIRGCKLLPQHMFSLVSLYTTHWFVSSTLSKQL